MTAPAEIPAGLFSYSPSSEGHDCQRIHKKPAFDGKCAACPGCQLTRLRHVVRRPDGSTHLVLRCTHCDGPDAHATVRKELPQ